MAAAPSAEPQTFSVSASTTSIEKGEEFILYLRARTDYVFARNLVGLATTLAIGFAVLVILARDAIPTRGWYDSFALGVILGLLGDEDLLGKLKVKCSARCSPTPSWRRLVRVARWTPHVSL